MLKRMWREDEGVLTFEWILLITLLVIGVVGGISVVRDAINVELLDVADAILTLDQSYTVCTPITAGVGILGGSVPCCTSGAVGESYIRPRPMFTPGRSTASPGTVVSCQ
jgi:Flp pilus assembly pilin Flp